jgi:sugar phosphate isomerase/epimerase
MMFEPKPMAVDQARRQWLAGTVAAAVAVAATRTAATGAAAGEVAEWEAQALAEPESPFGLRYMLPSCMYGYLPLEVILPEVRRIGATAIDIWPKVHGNQREQVAAMGNERFRELLIEHQVELGCITQYPLGPFRLQTEMQVASQLGCQLLVTGAQGPKGLSGQMLKSELSRFAEQLKPHLQVAEEFGVVVALENHANSLLESADALLWLVELCPSPQLGIALAPYHLPQDALLLAGLIRQLGDRLSLFYAWQYGLGSHRAMPKEDELLQLPGRGELDFCPLIAALEATGYRGWTEIFMHPFPRGIPIHETADEVTAEINRSRAYLERCQR